jgi:MinD superfamily P-loop ATPase
MPEVKELVVISGKGGTGKTSLSASFAVLAERPVIADCDVDAADLHLVLAPDIKDRHDFYSGHEAVIREQDCIQCGECLSRCRFGAVTTNGRATGGPAYSIDPISCEGCGVCAHLCPQQAIELVECRCGEWMVSETRCGPMVHARLGIAAESSGKLVATVRRQARQIAEAGPHRQVIVDGPPGIGCPVIASVTGATMVLVVTEPTVSGQHDLERVLSLTRHFEIPAAVCINKWDLNPELTERIAQQARQAGAEVAGRIRYDPSVTQAQLQERAVVEIDAPSAGDIRQVWNHVSRWQSDSDQNTNQ